MRVITASNYGGPEVLRVEERPAPQPQADDVLVEVKAAGVNLMDIYARRGMLGMFSLPLSLGVDGAGVVIAVGDRSTARVGDRVAGGGAGELRGSRGGSKRAAHSNPRGCGLRGCRRRPDAGNDGTAPLLRGR